MTTASYTYARDGDHHVYQHRRGTGQNGSLALQILSTVLFAIFALVTTIILLETFWPAGFALAIIMAWRGFGPMDDLLRRAPATTERGPEAEADAEAPQPRPSGNASFDAYRGDMLHRLEAEQRGFEAFLTRLREAKDKTEFDAYMQDRARAGQVAADEPMVREP